MEILGLLNEITIKKPTSKNLEFEQIIALHFFT
jgi:hypothetical protein